MRLNFKTLILVTIVSVIVLALIISVLIKATVDPVSVDQDFAGALFELLFYSPPILIGLFISWWAVIRYNNKVRSVAAMEHVESYLLGATKEKILHRELTSWEQYTLEQKYKETQDRAYDLDRRAPVFRIQGRLVQLEPVGNQSIKMKEEWSVRGFKLNEENLPDIQYKTFREGEELVVEFSPFSKYVWDVFKVRDAKRVWLMNLSEDSFNLLYTGAAKIIPRAAFSTHRIEEIEVGDYITFSCLNIAARGISKSVDVKVKYVRHYTSMEDLLNAEGWQNVFPNAKNFEDAVTTLDWVKTYPERIKKGGIYAVGVELAD